MSSATSYGRIEHRRRLEPLGKWAPKVEKENFKKQGAFNAAADSNEEGAYVETGGLLGAKAKGGAGGVAELEGSLKYGGGQKYDQSSVEKQKQKAGGKLGEAMPVPTVRGSQKHLGESVHHLEGAFSAKAGPFGGAVKVAVDWSTQDRNKGSAKLQAVKVTLEAGATLPMNQLAPGLGGYIIPLGASVAKGVRALCVQASQDKRTAGQNAGEVLSAGENLATAFTQLAGVPQEAFKPKFEFDINQNPEVFQAPVELKLSITGGYDFFESGGLFELKLEYIKGIDVNAGVFAMKIRKGQRLFRLYYDKSTGWNVD